MGGRRSCCGMSKLESKWSMIWLRFFDYFVSSKVFIWIFWFHEFFSSLIKMIHDDGYILLFRAFASSSLPPLPLALYSRWVVPRGGQTMLRLSGFSLLHHKISLLLLADAVILERRKKIIHINIYKMEISFKNTFSTFCSRTTMNKYVGSKNIWMRMTLLYDVN